MEISRVAETCTLTRAGSTKTVEAVVHDFKEKDRLTVVLNKSVIVPMIWNGKLYEGKMAGLDFTSDGPKVTKTSTGR